MTGTYYSNTQEYQRNINKFPIDLQGVPQDTDTFQSFLIEKLDNLRKFFHITKFSIKINFLNKFGKTVNLNFNGLTGVIEVA